MNRKLTDTELFTIDRFSYYCDERRAFVLIGESTVVVIEGEKEQDEMVADAIKSMGGILTTHPDFSSYSMDDGNALIEMNENVFGLINGKKAGITTTDKIPIEIALTIRSACLEAADRAECIAIIEPD